MKISNEYKKHIRGMFSELIIFFVLFVFGFTCWDIVYSFVISPQLREYQTLLKHGYSFVTESDFETTEYYSLKKLDNIITFRNSQGKKFNTNVYIQSGNALAVCEHLEPGEVAISRKIAEILNIKVGSVVNAEYPIYDAPVEYTVVEILPYMSDFYDVEDNSDFSAAIVGDDGTLYNQAKGAMVYFLNDSEAKQYFDKEYSYAARYDIKTDIGVLGGKNRIVSGIMVTVIFLWFAVCAYFAHRTISQEVIKYYYDGYDIGAVKRMSIGDHLIVLGIPTIFQELWMVLKIENINILLTVSAVIVCTVIITSFIGGRKFGRSNHI